MVQFRVSRAALVLCLTCAALSTGCGRDKGDGAAEDAAGSGSGTRTLSSDEDWVSNCVDSNRFGFSMDSRLRTVGQELIRSVRYHGDGSCGSPAIEVEEAGSFAVGTAAGSGRAWDLSFSRVTVTPVSNEGLKVLKGARFCGAAGWRVGEVRDITGASGGADCWPRTPRTEYDIYAIEDGKLFVGRGSSKESPERRPRELEREEYFRARGAEPAAGRRE